ncbi:MULTISPECIES: T9SS type A sorting domain-containing protein [Spirosoma]|uniref:T9SS type A sorting domain-containing protein n=1 Tax=Spirosoma liriopis TaxID=2937440 RepID=A0ABT0HN79_9BACT|nr:MULTISPECIES: T9SS type A sorting domain-containing protein [Spirosoma]MCK8493623.1 T9SS type A sorting domain-containing protein [Spirosoma liriopis]UHG93030.1 T9SS type A sorting domain-containing protein [Spirosoma oryzicola]
MIRKVLLIFLLSAGAWSASYAQDPSVGGIASVPGSISVGGVGTVQANFGNGSSTAIPQANNARYTINLPPNIGVTGSSFSTTTTPSNLTVNIGTYSPTVGTIVTVTSSLGDVPGNANYLFTLNVVGLSVTTGTPAPISINAVSSPAVGTNLPTNDNANGNITVTAGALPVGLVSFTAKANENRTVDLAWTTSLETNNKGFLVERSKDLKSFEKVDEISEVAANSNAQKHYKLTDQTPFSGTSYYRLTQFDLSGKATSFPAVSVVLREGAYGVYPNPVLRDQRFALSLDEPETAVVKFLSADGRQLPIQKTGVQAGNLMLRAQGNLSAGIYIMTVEERGQTRQHRIVVE